MTTHGVGARRRRPTDIVMSPPRSHVDTPSRIQRTVLMGLLISIAVGTSACLAPLGSACGDTWCPDGFHCAPLDLVCVKSGCGDAIVAADEECDDDNDANGDGCDNNCTKTACGNGVVVAGEECDDGNLDDTDGCLSTCQSNRCGDGKVNLHAEECDDGNLDDADDCLSTCQSNRCGDGKVNPQAEACDDGNNNNNDGCHNDCTVHLPVYVKASNTGATDFFGYSVAISADGSTLAVGAPIESSAAIGIGGDEADNSAEIAGAVYVFTRSGTTWSQQAYIKASNTGAWDKFGSSVALSVDGSTLAVGAPLEGSAATGTGGDQADNSAQEAGAVYVFTRSGTMWSQQAYVKASNTDAGDQFGSSVALSVDGSTLAVGAPLEASAATGTGRDQADNSAPYTGAVYVFTRSGTMWSQQGYMKASDTDAGDLFGCSVALSADGSTLAVGALTEASAATGIGGNQADNSAQWAGAVYVFTRSSTTWSQQAYIKASNTDSEDLFGRSVALSADGSTLAVGAIGEASATTGIDGDQADNSALNAGAVYVFTRNSTTWSQRAYIKASNTDSRQVFSASVALSADGSTLAVGAIGEDRAATGISGNQADDSAPLAGAVYVFTRSDTTWSQQAYVKASNTGEGDLFGYSIALSADGSTRAVGALEEDSAATGIGGDQTNNSADAAGAVYVYRSSGQQSLSTTAARSEPDAPASAAHSESGSPEGREAPLF